MAKTFKSFVYDVKAIFNPELTNGMCYGKFRLSPEYKNEGAPFGFDWIRTGDAKDYVAFDGPYSMHVGRYYENGNLVTGQNVGTGKQIFTADSKLFQKLCNSYPISNISLYPSPTGSRTPYYVPVLSIYPYSGKDRDIAKLMLEMNIIKSPAKIELRYNTSYFEINGMENISTKEGKRKVRLSIKCIQEFSEDQYIRIISYNSKGKGKNAGMLRVCKNHKQVRRELSVLLVNIKLLASDADDAIPFVGDAQQAQTGIAYYLRHALMNPQFDIIDLDLGYQEEFRQRMRKARGTQAFVINKVTKGVNATGVNREFQPLQDVITGHLKQVRNIENYDTIVYCLGTLLVRTENKLLLHIQGQTKNKYILLKKDYTALTACHETLHTLKLAHTFMNTNYANSDFSEFTYEKYKTDNLMDYQDKDNIRSNLWEWQWKHIRIMGYPEI